MRSAGIRVGVLYFDGYPTHLVAIVYEVEHPYAWMREGHADVWPGFEKGQVEGFFRKAGLEGFGYESSVMQ